MNLGDIHKVWDIKALKKKPGEDEAMKTLERIAKQVQPIMRKHKWRVKLLSEFCPNNPSLLGVNVGGGLQVKLRLRRPNRDWDFIPYDQVLDTMLHELCHNAHGPHNASFYKLWDELRKECEDLMAKGITGSGEGFDLPGKRLGGFTRQPPLSSLQQTAQAAAEKRARSGSLLPSGPKRLGGDNSIMAALSPLQAAAMAAERRLQDDIWCGDTCDLTADGEDIADSLPKSTCKGQSTGNSRINTQSDANCSNVISRKRNHEQNNSSSSQSPNDHPLSNLVDLTTGSSPFKPNLPHDLLPQKKSCGTTNAPPSHSFEGHHQSNFVHPSKDASTSGSMPNHNATSKMDESSTWECVTCTLLNPPLAPICKLCDSEKPVETQSMYKIWSCKFCTLDNSVQLDKCSACQQWRYSHGAPLSTRPPNLGT